MKPNRNRPFPFPALLLAAALAACGAGRPAPAEDASSTGRGDPAVETHARMAVFIMARCPHCAALLRDLLPLQRELGEALELVFGYVGAVDALDRPALDPEDAEVQAAALQVCAALRSVDREHLAFLECLYEGDGWRALPRGFEECAERAGLDAGELAECAADGEGLEGLELAVAAAAASGIEAAPTIIVEDRLYLGSRSRSALMTHLCFLTGRPETRPAACAAVEPPAAVEATLLVDARCGDPEICDVTREVAFLGMLVPTLAVTEVDYSSPAGRDLHRAVTAAGGPPQVPMLVLDRSLGAWPEVLSRLERYLRPFGDGWLMPLGQGWDPAAEICDNGTDDTGDGLADCADPACAGKRICRPEQPGRLDLFLMSQCPFGAAMLAPADRFLDHFGRDRRVVDLRLQFIGTVEPDGELTSMHGPDEVDEDLRMVCAQKLYPERYAFMGYAVCRAGDYRSGDWERCVQRGMSAARLRKCAEGPEGRALLRESFELADAMEVSGSPTSLVNNRHELPGRSAARIAEAWCRHNPSAACGKPVAPEPDDAAERTDICAD
jgi:protein-disulfide isomerase